MAAAALHPSTAAQQQPSLPPHRRTSPPPRTCAQGTRPQRRCTLGSPWSSVPGQDQRCPLSDRRPGHHRSHRRRTAAARPRLRRDWRRAGSAGRRRHGAAARRDAADDGRPVGASDIAVDSVVRPGATVARREGRADREASPTPDLQPYVAARDYIRAHANVRGQQYDVIVLGSRGERVYLSWRPDMGRHLGWVPAADGERQPS